MRVASPISSGSADQLRFKTLVALTKVIEGMSPQTAERMRAGSAIEDALREVARECIGIDWMLVHKELGVRLGEKLFDLSEVAGVRKIPVLPGVTTSHLVSCLEANGCRVHFSPDFDINLVRSSRDNSRPYSMEFPERSIEHGSSRSETEAKGIIEPTLHEWLLFQLGYVICSGEPWGRSQGFVRCGSSEFTFEHDGLCIPSVARAMMPEGRPRNELLIRMHKEDTKWPYLYTHQVNFIRCV